MAITFNGPGSAYEAILEAVPEGTFDERLIHGRFQAEWRPSMDCNIWSHQFCYDADHHQVDDGSIMARL